MPKYYFDRLEHLNDLIRRRSTGSPAQLAKKISVSKRTVYEYIDILKSLGAEIDYCRSSETYYYKAAGTFNFHFKLLNVMLLLIIYTAV